MTVTKIKLLIFLFFAGFLLLAVNLYVKTGLNYPSEYENDKNIIGEYQYYNIKTFFGATCTMKKLDRVDSSDSAITSDSANTKALNISYSDAEFVDEVFFDGIRIDIFNDILGFILIAVCCFVLSKYRLLFRPAFIFTVIGILLKIILAVLPWFCNGMLLCNLAIGFGISYLAAIIISTFFASKGFIGLIQDSCCRDERLWLNTSWFVSMVLFILIFILKWLDLYSMAYFFNVVLVLDVLLFYLLLRRADEFIARNCK